MSAFVRLLLVACLGVVLFATSSRGNQPASQAAEPALNHLYGSGSVTGGRELSLRVELTAPAPSGGIRVHLATTSLLIAVPGSVVVPEGVTSLAFKVKTATTATAQSVGVQAEVGERTKSRIVQVLPPTIKELRVQSRLRSGGVGKITVVLSGPAPQGGIQIELSSNRPSLFSPQSSVVVSPGRSSVSLVVPVGKVNRDTELNVFARLDGKRLVTPSLIRNYDQPTVTPTSALASETPTSTASPKVTFTPTASATIPVETITVTPSPTQTASPTGTPEETLTPTVVHSPEFSVVISGGNPIALKGSTVEFTICADRTPSRQYFISFRSSDEAIAWTSSVIPSHWILAPGSSGVALCASVSLTGRSEQGDNVGLGQVNVIANIDGTDLISPPVTFVLQVATPTQTPAITPTDSSTLTPDLTVTATPSPVITTSPTQSPTPGTTHTATISPDSTPSGTPVVHQDPLRIELVGTRIEFPRGATVQFVVCIDSSFNTPKLVSIKSGAPSVVPDGNINPTVEVLAPGACLTVSATSGGGLAGQFFLIANLDGVEYQGPAVTFVDI